MYFVVAMWLQIGYVADNGLESCSGNLKAGLRLGKFLVVPGLQPCEIAWRAEEGVFLLFQGELLLVLEAELLNRFVGCGELGVGGLLLRAELSPVVREIGEKLACPHLRA